MRKAVIIALAWLSLGTNGQAQEEAGTASSYFLSPGDVLEISVWREEDLKKQCLIAPDGSLSFPLVGEIQAAGKRIGELREELRERLANYLSDPEVSVALLKNEGNVVYVIGKVARPGQYLMQRPVDVLQALSMAGGVTPFADEDDILVLRRDSQGRLQTLTFDYTEVKNGNHLEQNILLQAGDTVLVP